MSKDKKIRNVKKDQKPETPDSGSKTPLTNLRKRAEKRLREQSGTQEKLSVKGAKSVIHELQVHQIELEMQNEELRKSQIELEESRKKYSDLYDFAPAGYFTFDKNGFILEVNLTGAALLQKERSLLIKKPFSVFVLKDDQDLFYRHRREVLASGGRQTCEVRLKSGIGSQIFVRLISIPVQDSSGSCNQIRSAVSNITEQRLAENALTMSEEKYRNIFEGANDGIIACDLKSGKFLFINKRMSDLTGYSEKEILKLGVKDLHPPESLPHVLMQFNRMAAGEATEAVDIPVVRKDKSIIYCNIGSSFLEPGKKTILLGFFRDVTARKMAETELKQRSKDLEALNKDLEAYSYTISHDLRAPLRSIEGFARAIMEDYADRLDETGKDYLRRVTSAVKRMSQLIDALLTMARLARAEVKKDTLDLSSIAQVIAHELKKRKSERQVEFIIAEKVKARGDINLLRIVLENLLDNAWKFTSGHPSAKIEFGATRIDDKDVYFVRDDGAGFDLNFADKLFSPFRRFHTETEFPGLGIGLATVHKIINKHGGKIWAESTPEKGATFYFTLT